MRDKAFIARVVAYNTAIECLESWECDQEDENYEEEMKQAKILAKQLKTKLAAFARSQSQGGKS